MKLIDFDGAFEAYLQDWFMRSKGLFRTYDEMEDQVPEVYQTFLDTPADFLDGQKPGEYFERFSDPEELTKWMVDYEKAGVPVLKYTWVRDMPHATMPEMSHRIWTEFFSGMVRETRPEAD